MAEKFPFRGPGGCRCLDIPGILRLMKAKSHAELEAEVRAAWLRYRAGDRKLLNFRAE